ncbi:hypothetical protein [Marivita sp. XM-24bin2]|uniref:hypothetical protein n=1 Tax=unclassified Marivita TaxID=2632480 RepID=UPI0025B836C7|nr:hypothetical protein [Marivita sp. XM-24bin2]
METFPTELGVLTCLMTLAASLWISNIVGVNKHAVAGTDPVFRPPLDQFPALVHRAHWVQRGASEPPSYSSGFAYSTRLT